MANPPFAIDPAIEDRASEDDREWFAARPTCRYRVRLRIPGECGDTPGGDCVLVTQIRPGVRTRTLLPTPAGVPLDPAAALAQVTAAIERLGLAAL